MFAKFFGLAALMMAFGSQTLLAFEPPSELVSQEMHHQSQTPGLSAYAGTWVRLVQGRIFMVLTLKVEGDQVSGWLSIPRAFNEGQGGDVTIINPEIRHFPVTSGAISEDHLDFTITDPSDPKDLAHNVFVLLDHGHAKMKYRGWDNLAPWRLQREDDSAHLSVASSWPAPGPKVITPELAALQAQLLEMVKQDQAADVPPFTNFKSVCEKNYPTVLKIYEKYGWPSYSVVGKDAAGQFWLLAVHQAPDHLDFAKNALKSMKDAVDKGEASKTNYALFEDSVLRAEGKPQHWGTSTECKDGKRVLYPVDDPANLEKRRDELELLPLSVYLTILPPCTQ
jgi:hypothetical protein